MSGSPISEDMIQGYVDGQLADVERAAVERHLALNPADAERVKAYRQQRDAIRAAFAAILHDPVPDTVRRVGTARRRMLRAAAVFGWIVLGGLLGWMMRGYLDPTAARPPGEIELVERARIAHLIYTAEPRRAVEIAASQEDDMIRWLSKRMNAAVRVPKLDQFGFEALGGRLLPGAQGPACQIMYQNAAGKRLTIYLARDPRKSPKPIRFSDKEAVRVVFWSDGTLAFAVSAEIAAEELERIAAAVAQGSRL